MRLFNAFYAADDVGIGDAHGVKSSCTIASDARHPVTALGSARQDTVQELESSS